MKKILLFLFSAGSIYGGACSSIQTGANIYGPSGNGISWGGFVAGSPTSTWRQNITNAPVDPNSAAWMATLGAARQNLFLNSPIWLSDQQGEPWLGGNIHYVHGNTQRRVVVRSNPLWSRTAANGSMTSGSAVLTVPAWNTLQGRSTPYFSQYDVGTSVSVAGVGQGGGTLNSYIASVQDSTHATLSDAASVTGGGVVNVQARESYPAESDPGTFPMPFSPRIEQWYGPNSRPFNSALLDRYLSPYTNGANAPGDQHIVVIDVDNCIDYELYGCWDDFANLSCASYSAYYLAGGDIQRPYNFTGGAAVSGMPDMFGALRYDEYSAGNIQHAILITALAGQTTTAFTGAATHAQCCGVWNPANIPFGGKLRLKSNFDASAYPASCAPLFTAMKTYGLIVTDGGYTGQLGQENSNLWPADCSQYMYFNFRINAVNFDVVQQANTTIYCISNGPNCTTALPSGSAPVISSFAASTPSITLGQSVVLSWSVSGVVDIDNNAVPLRNISYGINPAQPCSSSNLCSFGPGWIDGASHGESIIVTPPASGTYIYQLMVQNRYGRTTANATITVQ
jgi:hypothetical protein